MTTPSQPPSAIVRGTIYCAALFQFMLALMLVWHVDDRGHFTTRTDPNIAAVLLLTHGGLFCLGVRVPLRQVEKAICAVTPQSKAIPEDSES